MVLKEYLCWCEEFMPETTFTLEATDAGVCRIMTMHMVNDMLCKWQGHVTPADCKALRIRNEPTGGSAYNDIPN